MTCAGHEGTAARPRWHDLGMEIVGARAPEAGRAARDVAAERTRQDARWGPQNHQDGTGPHTSWDLRGPAADVRDAARATCDRRFSVGTGTWRDVLLEEVAEAFAESDDARLRAELVQVAAVAQAWIESIDRRSA